MDSRKFRVLVLSGGGGRGAFHAGVYSYLAETAKRGVDAEHTGAWEPDVVVGTSIGAFNGAAIVQGMSAADLKDLWLSMTEDDIQGLPPAMSAITRRVLNRSLGQLVKRELRQVKQTRVVPPDQPYYSQAMPLLSRSFSTALLGRWNNLLDTTPLFHTLEQRLGIRADKLSASDKILLINSTHIRSGEVVVYSNRPVPPSTKRIMAFPINTERIVASCSIPLVYPATRVDGEYFWDGAVVTNTPLGAAFDMVRDDATEIEVVVVMMTPWHSSQQDQPVDYASLSNPEFGEPLPRNIGEVLTYALDWILLSSFRAELKLLEAYNKIVDLSEEHGFATPYRRARAVVVAPESFKIIQSIIDYGDTANELIVQGELAAAAAFKAAFPAH